MSDSHEFDDRPGWFESAAYAVAMILAAAFIIWATLSGWWFQ